MNHVAVVHDLPTWEQGTMIPHVIHQVFFGGVGGSAMPSALRDNVDRLIAANPGWEHRLYDDLAMERFIADEYGPDILDRYLSIDPRYAAARVDLFRYLLMYRTGGIYLDIKSAAPESLDLIAERCAPFALSHWDDGPGGRHEGWGKHREFAHLPGGEFQQWHIIAAPGHPFLRAVILRVLRNIADYRPWKHGVGRDGVFRLSGPIAYTLAIAPIADRHPHQIFADERQIALTYNIMGEGKHRGIFQTHYALNAAPIVIRSGFAGMIDRLYTAPIRAFYALLAVKARLGVFVRGRPRLARALKSAGIIR